MKNPEQSWKGWGDVDEFQILQKKPARRKGRGKRKCDGSDAFIIREVHNFSSPSLLRRHALVGNPVTNVVLAKPPH